MAELPYTRLPHPMYDSLGGVPAIEEVRFSVTHNRGCVGRLLFLRHCLSSGAHDLLPQSGEQSSGKSGDADQAAGFQGIYPRCGRPHSQLPPPDLPEAAQVRESCKGRHCLAPQPCPNLDADHIDPIWHLLRQSARPFRGSKRYSSARASGLTICWRTKMTSSSGSW